MIDYEVGDCGVGDCGVGDYGVGHCGVGDHTFNSDILCILIIIHASLLILLA